MDASYSPNNGVVEILTDEDRKAYESGKRLPPVNKYVDLIANDNTQVRTFVHSHIRVRTLKVDGQYQVQCAAEFGKEYIDYLAGEMKFRTSQGMDNIVMITGEERSGKSTFAQLLGRALVGNVPLDNICFKIKDFNNAIMNAKRGDVIIMDEAGYDLYSQEWWSEFQVELVKKLMVIAKMQLTLILVIPHRQDLNSKIRDRRVKFWINVRTVGPTLERGYAVVRVGITNEWYQEIFWNTIAGCRFPGINDPEHDRYEQKKDAFIFEINSGDYEPEGGRGSKAIKARNRMIYLILKDGKYSQLRLSKETGIPQPRLSEIYKSMKVETDPEPSE